MPLLDELTVRITADISGLEKGLQRAGTSLGKIGRYVSLAATEPINAFGVLALRAIESVKVLVAGVREWLVGKLGAVFDSVGEKIKGVAGFFAGLADELVGNSIVPDMINAIGAEFAKLPGLVGGPAEAATRRATASFRRIADSAPTNLVPDSIALLPGGIDKSGSVRGQSGGGGLGEAAKTTAETIAGAFENVGARVSRAIGGIVEQGKLSFESLADAVNSIATDIQRTLTQAFVVKPISNAISSGIGSIISSFLPARQHGGGVRGGIPHLVGERGPELFIPRVPGRIMSNGASIAAMRGDASPAIIDRTQTINVNITPSPGFTARDARETGNQIGRQAAMHLSLLQQRGVV